MRGKGDYGLRARAVLICAISNERRPVPRPTPPTPHTRASAALSGRDRVAAAGDDQPLADVRSRQKNRRGGHPYRREPVLAAGARPALPAGLGDGATGAVVAEDGGEGRGWP